MKTTILIVFSFLMINGSLTGQTTNSVNNSQLPNKDTTSLEKLYGNHRNYHFNEYRKTPEIHIGRIEKQISDLNHNKYYQSAMKFRFHPDYIIVGEKRKYSLGGDNMPCIIPDRKGKLIIIVPDTRVIFL